MNRELSGQPMGRRIIGKLDMMTVKMSLSRQPTKRRILREGTLMIMKIDMNKKLSGQPTDRWII